MTPRLDITGIGNAIVDVIGHADDDFLVRHGIEKGAMTLVDVRRAQKLFEIMPKDIRTAGGSVANSIAASAMLGSKAAFIGKVAEDGLGAAYNRDLGDLGIEVLAEPLAAGPPTGRSLIMVTPDARRSMSTFLGASTHISEADIDADAIAASRIVLAEGYLLDGDRSRRAVVKAAEIARAAGRHFALTLSDPLCVRRHLAEVSALVRGSVTILFANEAELGALIAREALEESIALLQRLMRKSGVRIAVITRSARGAVVVTPDALFAQPAAKVPRVVDTTGAGDFYAAGFLHGLARGRDLRSCARIGALAAGAVIQNYGARPGDALLSVVEAMNVARNEVRPSSQGD